MQTPLPVLNMRPAHPRPSSRSNAGRGETGGIIFAATDEKEANTVGSEVYSGKTAYRPRTQVQELSGVKQNPDVGSDTGCVVEYDSQCNVIGVACWTGDITAQYLAPNTAYNSSATAKMEIIDKGAIVVSDNWSSLNEHAKDVDENDQDFTID